MSASGFNYNEGKLITIFLSQCTTNGTDLMETFNWDEMANCGANGIIIVPYFALNTGKNRWSIGSRGLSDSGKLAATCASIAKKFVSFNPNINIWIGMAGIDSVCYNLATGAKCLTNFTNYVMSVKIKCEDAWNNVKGFYYNQEAIYGAIDYNAIMKNEQILLMNNISYRIHTNFAKDLIWIPYYGYGVNAATVIKNIGYVADTTTAFDAVIMQPHYMCDSSLGSNFIGICASMDTQNVCYRDKVPVTPRPAYATAVLGCEIESNTYAGNHKDNIDKYTSTLAPYIGRCPIVYYWQGSRGTAYIEIKKFFG